jgi:hypothetical protein
MHKISSLFLIFCVATLAPVETYGQEATPATLLGFLRPGMNVGMQSVDGTTSVILTVYDDSEIAVARDVSRFAVQNGGVDELAEKYPNVRRELEEFTTKAREDMSRADPVGSNWVYLMPHAKTAFGTIVAIGNDYLIIGFGADTPRRTVLPQSSIGRIQLDGKGATFFDGRPRKR